MWLIIVILKAFGLIQFGWFWVLAWPFVLSAAVFVVLLLLVVIALIIINLLDKE